MKKFPKRAGHYYLDVEGKETKFPSVTAILSIIDKSQALMYWAGKNCAKIALEEFKEEEPELTIEEVMRKFGEFRKAITTRGKGVHNVYKNVIQKTTLDEYPEVYEPYVQGIFKFIDDKSPTHVMDNRTVKSIKYGFAGELDTVEIINNKSWLIDVKTGKSYREHELQLAAYKQALSEDGMEVDRTGVLLLPGDGTYQLIPKEGKLEDFLSVKKVWEWKNSKGE